MDDLGTNQLQSKSGSPGSIRIWERKEREKESKQASRKETTLGAASHSPLFVPYQGECSVWGVSLLYLLSHSTVNYSTRVPYWSWKIQSLDFPIKARRSLPEIPRDTKSPVFTQAQLLLLCGWSDWLIQRAQTSTCSCNMFFAWGPGIPNELLGIRKKPFIL